MHLWNRFSQYVVGITIDIVVEMTETVIVIVVRQGGLDAGQRGGTAQSV